MHITDNSLQNYLLFHIYEQGYVEMSKVGAVHLIIVKMIDGHVAPGQLFKQN